MVISADIENVAVLPRHFQNLGGRARRRGVGVGSQIAGAIVNFQTSIGSHGHDAVHAAAPGIMVALAQAKTYHLTSIALSSAGLATFPVKLLCRHV